MLANGWRAELGVTARLTFSMRTNGERFDRVILFLIRFPRVAVPLRDVEAQIEDLEVTERV